MSDNGTPLKYITTCKLCSQRFSNSALPIIGETPDVQTVRFVSGLAKHMKQAHSEQINQLRQEAAMLSTQFVGWLVLKTYETTDPNLLQSQERIRVWLQTLTRKHQLTDADLLDRIARLELAETDAAHVNELCKEIRDFLTEQGKYSAIMG